MILSNITQAKQFLPSLNLTLDNDRFEDFFRRAQEWLVSHVIGEELEEILETDISMPSEDEHKDLRVRCQRVIAEKALLAAIPEMDVQLTEAGFAVQNNDNFSPASSQRVDRLLATLPGRIADDVDSVVSCLLRHSDNTEAAYKDWRGTDQFKYLTEAFMPLIGHYNRYASPTAKTYEEYYLAIPLMANIMKNVAAYYVSGEEIERLKELYRDNDLLEIHRRAIQGLREVADAGYSGDTNRARNAAVCVRNVMLTAPDSFPAFKASDAFNKPTINLDGGKMVNFL